MLCVALRVGAFYDLNKRYGASPVRAAVSAEPPKQPAKAEESEKIDVAPEKAEPVTAEPAVSAAAGSAAAAELVADAAAENHKTQVPDIARKDRRMETVWEM